MDFTPLVSVSSASDQAASVWSRNGLTAPTVLALWNFMRLALISAETGGQRIDDFAGKRDLEDEPCVYLTGPDNPGQRRPALGERGGSNGVIGSEGPGVSDVLVPGGQEVRDERSTGVEGCRELDPEHPARHVTWPVRSNRPIDVEARACRRDRGRE